MNVMAKPDTAADELAIFTLSKMYGKHTVIYNKARPWTTLDPPYPMTETELHDNCQIHLVYVGKDSYGILRHKPFVETAAPLSAESMLDPMILCKIPKTQCQNKPWDLSTRHLDQPADTSTGVSSLDNNNSSKDQTPMHEEEQLTPIPEPGENVEVGCSGEMAVPLNQCMETDDLCYAVSEVKLYRLTNSELEKHLGKLPNENQPTLHAKGDNKDTALNTNVEQSPQAHTSCQPIPCTAYSRLGRPLQTTVSRQTYADPEDSDSDVNAVVPKADNKTPHSKPGSSGPCASRIAAQNKKTVAPEFGLKASKVYKRSDSPTYSITSSGASECHSDHDEDTDSDAMFEGFKPLTEEDQEKLTKLGKLRTTEYGLKKRKRIRSYICHKGGCTFVGKSIRELNKHHIKMHKDVVCDVCNRSFKTPSSLKRHSYNHGELKFPCDQCNESFAFQSELNFHKSIHKHVLKHSGMVWDCDEKDCGYSTDDRRNLRAHKRKHQKLEVLNVYHAINSSNTLCS